MDESLYYRLPAPALLADLILVVHALIVAFVVFGQLLVLVGGYKGWHWVRSPLFRVSHLLTIAFVTVQAWLGRLCPLTIWEQELRLAAGQQSFDGGFIQYWLGRLLFFDLPVALFAVIYSLFAAVVLFSWWWLPPRWSRLRQSG